MTKNPKQGSALLIVLGFLSFMVVSAVAFAIYMRSERLPSSALRRNVANRYLVKAALAQAMSRVDDAIHQDPYPGFCETNNQNNCYHDRAGNAYDWWEGRVFMPPDPEGSTQPGKPETRYAPIGDTVSVLNLEAFGYLPPPLINDVRFLSRASWAAKWDYFNFDAGRYAFCAVNVSDFFDLNALETSGPRTSDKPISMSYLLADGTASYTPDSGLVSSFERLVETSRPSGEDGMADVPYVSMLDYNLALGKLFPSGIGATTPLYSPFYCWIANQQAPGGDKGYMYGRNNYDANGGSIVGAERQMFVTDTWFPADHATYKLVNIDMKTKKVPDLADVNESSDHYGQPFKMSDLRQNDADVEKILSWRGSLPFWVDYKKNNVQKGVTRRMGRWDSLCLWDYLDRNNVPLSLCMPCTERVPMVAGVAPTIGSGKKFMKMKSAMAETEEADQFLEVTTFTADAVLDTIQPYVSALVVYPFKGFKSASYKVRAYAQVHLGSMPNSGANLFTRVSNASSIGKVYDEFRAAQWKGGTPESFKNNQCLFTLLPDGDKSVDFDGVEREADIYELLRLPIRRPNNNAVPILTRTQAYTKEPIGEGKFKKGKKKGDPFYTFMVDPLDANGNALKLVGQQIDEAKLAALNFAVSMAVWVQITDGSDTVDLVPATYDDDEDLLSFGGSKNSRYESTGAVGDPLMQPVLRFVLSDEFNMASILPAQGDMEVIDIGEDKMEAHGPFAYLAVDPRFNWAPENMLGVSRSMAGGLDGQAWLKHVFHEGENSFVRRCGQGGNGADTDCDPFMFVSNQGYLQSMGELAFIPKLNDNNGNDLLGLGAGGYDGKLRTDAARLVDVRCMWQGNPLISGMSGQIPVWEWGVEDSSARFGVNPYTDNLNIFRSAVVNTPMNFWASGTNYVSGGKVDAMDSSTKKSMLNSVSDWKKYVIGKDNDFGLDLQREEIDRLTAAVFLGMRGGGYVDQGGAGVANLWTKSYDDLWSLADGLFYNDEGNAETEAKKLLGQTFGSYFHCADRKALYSFWRMSCKNRQQLFLIFVRAESTALGGSGEGTPAQQGGRAVALVWRDPETPTTQTDTDLYEVERSQDQYVETRHPHRMRVLFYHQFD